MGKRILVADDSLTIQKAFAMVLSGQDYALVFARSPDEALAAAKAGRPDLVYADSVMGTGSGYDLCASIKADPGLRGVPVHLLTSNQNPYDEARALRAGADGQFFKPFDSQALLDSVSAALTAAAPAPVRVTPAPATRPAPAAPKAAVLQGSTTEGSVPPNPPAGQPEDEDSYGEFTIERSPPTPAASSRSATWPGPVARTATPTPAAAAPPSRPSLIPGVSPPGPMAPTRPAPALPGVIPAAPSPSSLRAAATRTIMGFPAVGGSQPPPPPATAPAASSPQAKPIVPRPSSPVPAPVVPRPTPPPPTAAAPAGAPAAPAPARIQPAPAPVVAAVSSAIDQKVAAIAARGKEYEAIANLSREIIEQVVWEVVPELAEAIIKQQIDRLIAAKR